MKIIMKIECYINIQLKKMDSEEIDRQIHSRSVIPIDEYKSTLKDLDSKHNNYSTSKSVSQISLNTTTIQTQIYIFVLLLSMPITNGFQITLLIFIPASLILQFTIFVLLIILAKSSKEKVTKKYSATTINSFVTALSGLLVIITSLITIVSWKAGVGSTNFNSTLK